MRHPARRLALLATTIAAAAACGSFAAGGAASGATGGEPDAVAVLRCDLPAPAIEVTFTNPSGEPAQFSIAVEGQPVDPALGEEPSPLVVAPGASAVMDYTTAGGAGTLAITVDDRVTRVSFGSDACDAPSLVPSAPAPVMRIDGRW
jgi:hypothetical protein